MYPPSPKSPRLTPPAPSGAGRRPVHESLARAFFGPVEFGETEQLREFQYRFLMVLLAFGALATAVFLVIGQEGPAAIPAAHVRSMTVFTTVSALLWLVLRGHKHRFLAVAWAYEVAAVMEHVSTMVNVPADELRILWLFTNIPGVYLLLGRTAGGIITALTVVAVVAGNPFLAAPYSPNALATAVVSIIYLGAFFHAYASQMLTLFLRLRELALRDTLTGVFNARAYYAVCERLIRAADRSHRPFAVLFADLDHFKTINDTWGHAAGDAVLKAVAECLTRQVRAGDVVGRIGGEEFSIFLPDTDLREATALAERLRQSIELLRPLAGDHRVPITASIGVATREGSRGSMMEIQRAADQAMYQAKAAGRNRVSALFPPAAASSQAQAQSAHAAPDDPQLATR